MSALRRRRSRRNNDSRRHYRQAKGRKVMAEQVVTHHSMRAQVARCLFCGAVGNGWWDCCCVSGVRIREGKVPRPRTVMREGVPIIECCAELRAAARLAGVIRMDATISTPVTILETPNSDETRETPNSETPNSDETRNDETLTSNETRNCVEC